MDLYIKSIAINKIGDFNKYPINLPVFQEFSKLELKSKVVFFVGENGSGKSTLLEAIAVKYGFNAEGGSKNFNFSTYDSHSDLHKYITLVKGSRAPKDGYFFRAESFYNLATQIQALEVTDMGIAHYMSSPMERAFYRSYLTVFLAEDCIYWMNLKPHYHPQDSLPCWQR